MHCLGSERCCQFLATLFLQLEHLVPQVALQLLLAVREGGQRFADLAAQVQKCPQVLLNIRVRARPPLAELRKAAETLARWEEKLGGRARFVVRYSGTEPLARVMVEGDDGSAIDAAAREIAAAIHDEIGATT